MTEEVKKFIGIDVSKGKLDIFNKQTGEFNQIKNTIKDIKQYVKEIKDKQDLYAIIDLTGGYEAQCVKIFYESGIQVIRAEGRKVKSYARALGIQAKTDKIDAELLADYGQKCFKSLRLYKPEKTSLSKYVMRINDLKAMKQEEKNRLKMPNSTPALVKSVKRSIHFLETEISELETFVKQQIFADEQLKERYETLRKLKGIGDIAAYTLVTLMPELGSLNRRQAAALAGVAPYAKDSGTLSSHRFTRNGRKGVKSILFLAALVAIRYNPSLKAFYLRLIAKPKPKMVAITAVMRKLILFANSSLKPCV